ncbi:MAG: hypothetical protein KAH95_13435 [Spirochaetales bacterium]|nr:hypothetical protein [Spirochaetales bacterium]
MSKNEQETEKSKIDNIRKYPPLWEKSVPVLIIFAGILTLSLIIIAVVVIFTKTGI